MNRRTSVDSVVTEAERLSQVWGDNPKFAMGDVTLEQLQAETDKLRNLRQSRDEMRVELSKLVDDTKDQLKFVDSLNKRGRSGMKAIFGPDSAQYAQVGGKRQSERKPHAANKPKSLAA